MLALNQVTGELNAILIKELRQELRVRGFIWSFIGFHIAMIILTLSSFSAPALPHKWTTILSTTLFWMMLAIPLFISVLVRALTAFRKETTAKELELIFLTSISSWQLVFYKWLALCLQGILLLTAALPYVIVRYVIGSLNLLDAFISLGLLLLFTMLLAAVALMISAQNAHRPRFSLFRIIVVLLLGVPVANQLLVFVFLGFSQFFGPFTSVFNSAFSIMVLIYTLLVLLLLLEFAASHISRPAENHAYIKRALGILALTMGWIFHVSTTDHAWLIHISIGAYLLIICVNALCEDPVDLQSLYTPFLQGNLWKRCLRMWLYPGWPSGIIYTLSICVLFFATMPPPPHTIPNGTGEPYCGSRAVPTTRVLHHYVAAFAPKMVALSSCSGSTLHWVHGDRA
ncbi:hypothetical protein C2W62_23120 [Candidatus Entotheonella serta]|nr:hypothetical protein C2W62_23120 [Candidatus Entotheonella serta]